MNAFAAALATLTGDPNLGVDILYVPNAGTPISCRAVAAEPDIDEKLTTAKIRDVKRTLLIQASDVPAPARNDTVQFPPSTAPYRVVDFKANDPQRLAWKLDVAPE